MQQCSTKTSGGPSLDETGLCLLSLDGGGVRGLSTLLILKRLMDRTNAVRKELGLKPVKPWELFDLMGGTSTGGLIAIMLGRLKMDVSECIQSYTSMFQRIFEKQKHKYPVNLRENFGYLQNRFDSDILREAIREIVKDRGLSETEYFNCEEEERSCRVFVCAIDVESTTPVCIRDYNLVDESNDDHATIIEAALATSAATTFFKPVKIGGRRYMDGALGSNNPIKCVWTEAQNIWCPEDGRLEPMVKCLVSIGTGNPGLTSTREDVKGFLLGTLKDIATETENTTAQSLSQHRGLLDQQRYFRYNVDQGLQDVGLEEYRKQPLIESATRTYLANELQKRSLRDCAKNLGMKESSIPMSFNLLLNAHAESPHAIIAASTYFRVPAPGSEKLTGREDLLSRLENVMVNSDTHTRAVLYGFSGIGKTRIAREYAYKWKNSTTTSVFWVHAGTRQRIEKDYLDIAKEVGIPGWKNAEFDQLGMVKDWFERQTRGRWILILDNADDIDMLYGDSSRLADYFPRAPNGAILLTTRNKKVGIKFTGSDRNLVHVGSLPVVESIRLLQAKINLNLGAAEYAHLADALHNVPLALVQAAAFILQESLSISAYLRLYDLSDAARIQLLEDDFEDDTRDKETQNAVARTLVISFEQIKKCDVHAAELLAFMSMLDPQAIPRSLLPGDDNPVTLTKALGTLQAFSLITKSSRRAQEDELYDLHRLVRLVMFGYLRRNNTLEIFLRKATWTMLDRFPDYELKGNREICRMLFPHAAVILDTLATLNHAVPSQVAESSNTAQLEMESNLLYKIAQYLTDKGDHKKGQVMMQKAWTIRDWALGPEHEDTLRCASQALRIMLEQRHSEKAVQLGRRTLLRAERALGRDHACTLWIMCYLGFALGKQGTHDEAGDMLQRAWQRAQKKHGEESRLTLTAMSYFAANLSVRGKHEEAEQVMRKALQFLKTILGEEDPDTLMCMSCLAFCLNNQNKHEKAAKIFRSILQTQIIALGEEHPDTLASMSNLAHYLNTQEKYEEAEKVARQTLLLRQKVLGEEHPDTLRTMSNLAYYLDDQDKHEEAEQMARQTLQLQRKVLGEEHPDTLKSMSNLACYLGKQDKYEEAEKLARQALQLRQKVLGQGHPDTIRATKILMNMLQKQGKLEEVHIMELQLQKNEKLHHKSRVQFLQKFSLRGGMRSRFFGSKGKDGEFQP